MNRHEFGDRLLQLLGRADFNQAWLARKLGVHRSTVTKWITGENQIPPEKLQECCELLDLNEPERLELFVLAGYKPLLDQIAGLDQHLLLEQKAYDAILYLEPGNFRKPEKLYGRQAILLEIHTFLDQGMHVLLTGIGGTGKTALAASAADERIRRGLGPVLWLGAGGGTAETFFDVLLAPLGRHQELGTLRGDARLYATRRILAQSGVKLIVLDDFQTAELLPQIRTAVPPSIPLLITSRHSWANVDVLLKVAHLAPAEALELLTAHASNTSHHYLDYSTDFDSSRLCETLQHHPLAILIAAAWLRQNKKRSGSLIPRLNAADETALTLRMPPGFGEAGHESVMVMLDETFRGLPGEAQAMLAPLAGCQHPM